LKDSDKTREQLITELAQLRQRVAKLEAAKRDGERRARRARRRAPERRAYGTIPYASYRDGRIETARRPARPPGHQRAGSPTLRLPQHSSFDDGSLPDELRRYDGLTFRAVEVQPDGRRVPVEVSISRLQGEEAGAVLSVERRAERQAPANPDLRRRQREVELLAQVVAAVASETEPRAILEAACRELAGALDVPHVTVSLLDRHKSLALVAAEYRSAGRPSMLHQALPVRDDPAFQHLFAYKAPLLVVGGRREAAGNGLAAVREALRRRGAAWLLMVPLIVEGEVAGSLNLEAVESPGLSPADVGAIWSVADLVAGALARAERTEIQGRVVAAVEQAAESVALLDAEGVICYVNPAFERITGYGRAEAVGQKLDLLKSGEQDPDFYGKLWATLRAGQAWHERMVSRKKDGTLYTDEASITPVFDAQGAIANYLVLNRDVTRELRLEAQLRQAQKMEAVGQLTAGIAHEFNNLLTAINGFAELAQLRLSPKDPVQELVRQVRHSGGRAAGLVRQLLAFSRAQIIEPQVVDLNAVVGETQKLLEGALGEEVVLTTRLAPDLWAVQVDPAQFEQVIVNLAVNARDAMPRGGRLTLETANAVLSAEQVAGHPEAKPGEYVRLAVSDTGVGMSEEVQSHLFEPFFTTKARGKGTGLGLAMVYGIVEQAGGHITVDSRAGAGTAFRIYLPRCEAAPKPAARPGEGRELPYGGETILVVEDNERVREVVRLVLEQQGYRVLEAPDGQGALRLAAGHAGHIHLLLTDVVMPGLNGQALARSLARSHSNLKTLFISGYPSDDIVQRGVLEPGISLLQKPFTPFDLARKVRQVLDSPARGC
jgi:PAS domain S-box-containing protein